MAFQNIQNDDEEQQDEEELQQPQKRMRTRPSNNEYDADTGPNTGLAARRTGTINRDGTTSPVSSSFGTATGSLSQPIRQYSPEQLEGMKESNAAGFGKRAGRLDARPRNNIYMPGTGPGTGRTAIRVGTINRDGSASPVSKTFGTATGSLSQRGSRLMTPRPTPADAYKQRQSNVANAKANGTFDAARAKFNGANSGQIMDEQGNIGKNPNATKFDQVPDGLGGYKMVPVPPKKAPPPVQPQPLAATPGLAHTIKHEMQQIGSNPLKGMEMPKPLMPAVIGSSPLPVPSASLPTTTSPAPSPLGVKPANAPAPSVLGMPGTGTLGGSTQPFGSGAGALGLGGPPKLPGSKKDDPLKVPGRAKGGPVQAGKPYLVGEEGPEIIVPKQSGTVVPNHAITTAVQGATTREQSQPRPRFLTPRQPPAEAYVQMRANKDSSTRSGRVDSDKRTANAPRSRFFEARETPANARDYFQGRHLPARADGGPVQAGKPYMVGERGPEIIVPKKGGAVAPGQDPAAKDWLDEWRERDVDRAEKARPAGHVQIEREQGLSSVRHMLKGKPTGLVDELGTGLAEGATRVGQLAASVGSYLPGQVGRDYEARRKVYAERAEIMKKYRERDEVAQKSFHSMTPGTLASMGVSAIPELYNPVNKAGWGAKAINAAWHGVRGYLPNKSVHDGVVGSLSSVAGENAEDLVKRGKMVAGNVAGTITEKILHKVLPDDKPVSEPPPVLGPIPKPVYGPGLNPMPMMPGADIQPAKVSEQVPEKKLNGYEIELMKKKIRPSLRPMQTL